MTFFEELFGIPDGHDLRPVPVVPGVVPPRRRPRRWEFEEYDGAGKLVAVYEAREAADSEWLFIKYSPQGWILRKGSGKANVSGRARESSAEAA